MGISKKLYPLSYPQKGIWYKEMLFSDTGIGNISATMHLKEVTNTQLLKKAINIFIQKNESIRLKFHKNNGKVFQYISEYSYKQIEEIDLSIYDDDELNKWYIEISRSSFNLLNNELFQFFILKLGNDNSAVFLKVHHLLSDALSLINIANQIIEYYHCLKNDIVITKDKRTSYINYLKSEEVYFSSERMKKDRIFWNNKLSEMPVLTTLTVKPINENKQLANRRTCIISRKITASIRKFCHTNKVSVFTFFLSVLVLYISRVTSKTDMIIGIPVLNRSTAIEKNTVGMYINTIPIRLSIKKGIDFVEFSRLVSQEWLCVLKHQKYPNELIMKDLRAKYSGIDKLFDIVLSYQNGKLMTENNVLKKTKWHFNGYQTESLVLHINDRELSGKLILDYDYLQHCFCEKSIRFINTHLMSIIEEVLLEPERSINTISIMSLEEKNKVLFDFNSKKLNYDKTRTITSLFEEQVKSTSNKIALSFNSKELTYAELNSRADRIAELLLHKGVKVEQIIGILVYPSIELIIGILGILKAGGAFLPLDPEYPEERIAYMLKNSACSLILSSKAIISQRFIDTKIEFMDIYNEELSSDYKKNLMTCNNKLSTTSKNLAYVIYTSGSTGNPKGVMIEHKSVHNFYQGITQIMSFSDKSRVLSAANISFDLFIFEAIPTLLKGGTLVLASENQRKSALELAKLIESEKVNIFLCTPSRMQMLLNDERCHSCISNLEEIMLGGEVLNSSLLVKLSEVTTARVINCYGPTEATVLVSAKIVDNFNQINIGKPIANNRIFILDKNLEPVPIGVEGELCVAGDSLARGYINNTAITEEKFVTCNIAGECIRIYRTGDLARWYPKGEIEYLGRVDQQVKLRGYRIELGEIENKMTQHNDIISSVVVDFTDINKNKYLCGYYISNKEISGKELKTFLSESLPNYMIPVCYKRISELPITQGGKINRKYLPTPNDKDFVQRDIENPKTEIESQILNCWKSLLNNEHIGVLDSFFDVGGDSLLMVRLISWIYKEYNIDIPINKLTASVTVRDIANYIANSNSICYEYIENKKQDLSSNISERKSFILIRKGHNNSKNLFFIHAGNGEIQNYIELCNSIDNSFNCWGIRYKEQEPCPKNTTINEIAKDYVNSLLKIQKEGCFNLFGWCIGGSIAFEMSNILAEMGCNKVNLTLINTFAPGIWNEVINFSLLTELEFINKYIPQFIKLANVSKCKSIEDLWDTVVVLLQQDNEILHCLIKKLPKDVLKAIPNNCLDYPREIVYYINILRTLHNCRNMYKPTLVNSSYISFINAFDDKLILDKKKNILTWQNFCLNQIEAYYVQGDHYTIFDKVNCKSMAEIINKYILKYNPKKEDKTNCKVNEKGEGVYIA